MFIQVVPEGIAANCGKLRMGDRILKVNGSDVSQATHQEAVMELLRPGDEIKLTIQHDPLPIGFQVSVKGDDVFLFSSQHCLCWKKQQQNKMKMIPFVHVYSIHFCLWLSLEQNEQKKASLSLYTYKAVTEKRK